MNSRSHRHCQSRRAFTLVELLVVIGIIALLISILMPSLSKAREAARSVSCMANLRAIGQGMQLYVSQYKGNIPGSPWTSGRHLWRDNGASASVLYTRTNVPTGPTEYFDFIAPLAQVMGLKLPNTTDGRIRAWQYYDGNSLRQFQCPSNFGTLATLYGSNPGAPFQTVGQSISYGTAGIFLMQPNPNQYNTSTGWGGFMRDTNNYWDLPGGYTPRITRIGASSTKIYAYDSGKWSRPIANAPPTYSYQAVDESVINSTFTDYGAFHGNSKSLNRKGAYTTLTAGENDARIFGFRHGTKKARANKSMYRFNAVFFDGHVENIADIDGANPAMWMPRGTVMTPNPATNVGDGPYVSPDVVTKYGISTGWRAP